MKRILLVVTILFLSIVSFAQAPQLISYQAVVRNSSNALITNSTVGVAISIVKDSANGTTVYRELQTANTNANGVFSIVIGNGLFTSGSISGINWSNGVYFIKSQIDPTGGINFTITGASQLLSVPYALYAANGNPTGVNKGDMQYWDGGKWVVLPAGSNGSTLIMCNGIPTWGGCSTGITAPSVVILTAIAPYSGPGINVGGYGNSLVTSNGGSPITAQGVCWSTSPNPTLANSYANGTFVATKDTFFTAYTGMNPSTPTTYYLRAYATNSAGTSYSNQITLQALGYVSGVTAPVVQTISASSTSTTTASAKGIVTSSGGSTVTARGFCWSATNTLPTLADYTILGTFATPPTDTFYTNLSSLAANTTYYLRAYATNSVGTSYGNLQTFTTSGATSTFKIGQSYGGGTVFYVDATGQHGLIAALSDAGNLPWDLNQSGGGTFTITNVTDTTLGSGLRNTNAIKVLLTGSSYAANMATQTANGYSDWYLPSLGELQLMFLNLAASKLGNLSQNNVYWSSSEYAPDGSHQAWVKDFGHNSMYGYWKSNNAYVRPIRSF